MGKGTDIHYPEQPSYGESMRDAMQAQIDLGDELYEAEAEYRPKYAQLETDILGRTLLGEEGGQEFKQRGLLDIMGAPAYEYATGDVEQMRPDPYGPEAQFARGYGGQQRGGGGQVDWDRMRGGPQGPRPARQPIQQNEIRMGQIIPSGGMEQRGRNGMSGKVAQTPLGQQRGGYGGGMEQRGRNGMSGKVAQTPLGRAGGGRTMQGTGRVLGAGQDRRVRRPAQRGFQGDSRFDSSDPMSDYSRMIRQVVMGPEAAREAEARFNAYRAPAEIGGSGMVGQTREPGMTGELDHFTGRPKFGGMAQYGADIAEYGAGRQRAADIRDVDKYGQLATRALRKADPLSGMMLGRMAGIAGQEMAGAAQGRFDDPLLGAMRGQAGMELAQGDLGYGGLLGEMGVQAREDLAARDSLTARERQRAIQESRQASEARGRQMDPLAAVNELEALERARAARRQERRGFAGQVMSAEEARKQQGRQYAANLLAMEGARRGEARGYGQQVLGASRAMSADPFMAILGRPSGAGQQIAQQGLGQAQYGLSAGPGVVFNPEAGLSYMLGQQTNQMNLAGAQAGARAQRGAGMMGMLGRLGGAAIGLCWVAREVYGESNPKWKQFREWMLNKAPDWFREWYLINGESVAEHIKDKPELKARIKIFMDSKLEA